MLDPELEYFKTSIDLRAYAASKGYMLGRKASWRGSAVMRHPNGDKEIIKRDMDDHYVYFSVRDEDGCVKALTASRLPHLYVGKWPSPEFAPDDGRLRDRSLPNLGTSRRLRAKQLLHAKNCFRGFAPHEDH